MTEYVSIEKEALDQTKKSIHHDCRQFQLNYHILQQQVKPSKTKETNTQDIALKAKVNFIKSGNIKVNQVKLLQSWHW